MQAFRPTLISWALLFILSVEPVIAQPNKIGALADVSGPTARIGEDCKRGYVVAEEIAKERPSGSSLNVVYGDNQNDAKVGLSEFRRMIDVEQISAVVTTRSHIAMSLGTTSVARQVPVLAIAAHPLLLEKNPYAFRFIASAAKEGSALAQAAKRLSHQRIAVVTLNDEAYLASSSAFVHVGLNIGLSIVASVDINPEEIELKTIAAKLVANDPDAVFVNLGAAQLATFIRKLRGGGWTGRILSNFLLASPDVGGSIRSLIDGAVFTESEVGGPIFTRLYEARFHEPPSQLSYACFVALSAASQTAYSGSDGQGMFQALRGLKHITVPDGQVLMVNREAELYSRAYQIKDGKRTALD